MKKKLLLTTFVILFSSLAFSQGNQIADTTKTWNTVYGELWAWLVAHVETTSTRSIMNEEIINDTSYFGVYHTNNYNQDTYLDGFLREDTITKQVFFRNSENENEGLIYDFSIEIGDTVIVDNYFMGFTNIGLRCANIDTVIHGNIPRKHFHMDLISIKYPFNDIWIEGVGSVYGLLNSACGTGVAPGGFASFICCSQADTVIYFDTAFNECYIEEFYPKIISEYFDTAYLNTYYEFQVQLSDTSNISSVSWEGGVGGDFSFNDTLGIITGFPTTVGSFSATVVVSNDDIGYKTDILQSEIVVVLQTDIPNENLISKIKIFPNPCKSELNINIIKPNNGELLLEIYNNLGVIVEKRALRSGLLKLDCSHYEKGIYLFKISNSENKIVKIEKIIIE